MVADAILTFKNEGKCSRFWAFNILLTEVAGPRCWAWSCRIATARCLCSESSTSLAHARAKRKRAAQSTYGLSEESCVWSLAVALSV
jgi:hypothetical protein